MAERIINLFETIEVGKKYGAASAFGENTLSRLLQQLAVTKACQSVVIGEMFEQFEVFTLVCNVTHHDGAHGAIGVLDDR